MPLMVTGATACKGDGVMWQLRLRPNRRPLLGAYDNGRGSAYSANDSLADIKVVFP